MLEKNNKMINEITELVTKVTSELANEINKLVVFVYWNIGRIIVSNENEFNNRLEYGKEVLKGLSNELTKHLGKGYSYTNLKYMRLFYKKYPEFEKVAPELTWTHYCELITIKNKDKRNFYERECINSNWSVRELRRQLDTSLFERLLLSDGKTNKEKVYELLLIYSIENPKYLKQISGFLSGQYIKLNNFETADFFSKLSLLIDKEDTETTVFIYSLNETDDFYLPDFFDNNSFENKIFENIILDYNIKYDGEIDKKKILILRQGKYNIVFLGNPIESSLLLNENTGDFQWK